jgi:hypothetical protein
VGERTRHGERRGIDGIEYTNIKEDSQQSNWSVCYFLNAKLHLLSAHSFIHYHYATTSKLVDLAEPLA